MAIKHPFYVHIETHNTQLLPMNKSKLDSNNRTVYCNRRNIMYRSKKS